MTSMSKRRVIRRVRTFDLLCICAFCGLLCLLDSALLKASNPAYIMSQESTLRIGVIEDDQMMMAFIKKLIAKTEGLELCGAWMTGEEALREIKRLNPTVVLVDLELPGISGEDTIRAVSALLPTAAIVVLTVHEDAMRVFGALQAGANGYLIKGCGPIAIIDGIFAAHRGGSPLSPEIAGLVIRAFQKNSTKKKALPLPHLSPRERQILDQLATGKATKEVASELHLSYETVRDYLKQIYQKLHVRSRTEAVLRYLENPLN